MVGVIANGARINENEKNENEGTSNSFLYCAVLSEGTSKYEKGTKRNTKRCMKTSTKILTESRNYVEKGKI